MQEPIPIAVIIFLSALAMAISFALPRKEDLELMTQELKDSQKRFKQELLEEEIKMQSQVVKS